MFFNISSFYFFYFASVGVYIIFLPKVLHDIGYSTFEIGVVLAVAPLMRFATPFLFLKHIKLNQKVFKTALYVSIISTSLFYISIDNFYQFLINNAILATCLSLILPYLEVSAVKNLGKEKYGKSRLYGSIGFMVIALLLGKFLSNSFSIVHYYLILNILTVIFALLLLKYDDEHHEEKNQKNSSFSFLKYWPFWLSLLAMQLSFGAFYNFFTLYETQHGLSLELISYLWSFGVICEILMLYFQAPLLKKNLLNIIKFCVAITAIRWFLLYLFPDFLYLTFFTQSLHAFSFGLYHSAVVIYLYTLYENKKLAQQFMYGVAYGLGGFIGAFISGIVFGSYLFLYSTAFAVISLLFLYFMKENKENIN